MKLCYPIGKHNIKIFGPDDWSHCQYLGNITHAERLAVYASATVCFADTPEEALCICAAKGCCYTVEEYRETIGYTLDQNLVLHNGESLISIAKELKDKPKDRTEHIEYLYSQLIPDFTYLEMTKKLLGENK
jgi:hypothetical protein